MTRPCVTCGATDCAHLIRVLDLREQWGYAEIAAHLGVQEASARHYAHTGRLPAPAGKFGQSPWWWADTIRDWHATRPGKGGRPRQAASELTSAVDGEPCAGVEVPTV